MDTLAQQALSDGRFTLHVERPAAARAPVVVVLHEVFGVNDDLRATCRELAGRGYIAICPDLFWRIAPGFSLSRWTEADLPRVQQLYRAFDRDAAAQDVAAVLAHARGLEGATGKAGLIGYCMGGLMTLLATARHGADASVAYYPGEAELYLDEAAAVRTPLLLHLAEEDEFVPKPAQRAIAATVAGNGDVRLHAYPGCRHAFARHGGEHFDAAAAALANDRTWRFLDDRLR
jgi:carboxymethylenebutenolidase